MEDYLGDLIRAERTKLSVMETETVVKVASLQNICPHRRSRATKEAKANTGNYDKGSDVYWYQFKCSDCLKFWTEPQ